jgi:GNAT superfamily N-acetyltransferase
LLDEVDTLHRVRFPNLFQSPSGAVREWDYILGLLADENVGLFVAEQEGKLVGLVHVLVRDAPPVPILVPRRYAILDTLVVKRIARRQGIGHKLMDRAHEWAMLRGATSVELNVFEFNQEAIAFYRSMGYAVLMHRMSKPLRR